MNRKEKILAKLIYIVAFLLIFFSCFYIFSYCYDLYASKKQTKLLDEIEFSQDETQENMVEENITDDNVYNDIVEIKTERMLKLEELQKENPDIIGWIEIENTNINYPVLQAADNDFYMNRNYKKQWSSSGSIFLDKDYNWEPASSNLLIYGHNMNNGTMFQNLLKYKNKNFFDEHPYIKFTTNKEDAIYEIIAVFESRVYYQSEENVFRYYYFINANNEEEFNNFVSNAKKASLYDTGKTAIYGEQLMTLSTCAYHTKNGRFVIVAKKT